MNMLKLLQYNVQKSRIGVMIPLIEGNEQYDIIALQEPWLNPQLQATYCPTSCPYTAVFPRTGRARTCFLVNKAILVSLWTQNPAHLTLDYCRITLQLPIGPLTIHNIYSPTPLTLYTTEWESPIDSMLEIVHSSAREHLIVGDFNLHHLKWGGDLVEQAHAGAARVVEALETGSLKLLSVPGEPTREKHGNRPSTLDLTLATLPTASRTVSCSIDRDTVGSDHLPIITKIQLSAPISRKPTLKQNFKKLNNELVALGAERIRAELEEYDLTTTTKIDHYCHQLVQRMQSLIAESVPYKQLAPQAKPWWNSKISEAIYTERQLKRQWRHNGTQWAWDDLATATAAKKKLIREAKRAYWRASVHEAATSNEGIWRIAKWAR